MKITEIYEELVEIAKKLNITVRKENGKFKSGFCVVDDDKYIVVNRSTPIESTTAIIARTLLEQDIKDVYIKPAVREYIEKQKDLYIQESDFNLKVDY